MRGIITIALNKPFYKELAYTLAKSFKGKIPVAVLTDGIDEKKAKAFSHVIEPRKKDYYDNLILNPFKLKPHVYDYSPFDETIYLDADSIFYYNGRSIDSLFEQFNEFQIHEVKRWNKTNFERCKMVWLKHVGLSLSHLFSAYNISPEFYPEYNSSFIYFKKSEANKRYFEQVQQNYTDRRTRFRKIGGHYPDEMAFNLASAQLAHYSEIENYKPVLFHFENKKINPQEGGKKYYFLGMAGGYNSPKYVAVYNYMAEKVGGYGTFNNRKKIFFEG